MNEQWSPDGSAVKIFGDHSPHPVIVLKEVVEHFGTTEEAFHAIHRLRKAKFLPRVSASENHPFKMRDIELAYENQERGELYWRFGTVYPTPREYVRGYYHVEGDEAIFFGGTRARLPKYDKRRQ